MRTHQEIDARSLSLHKLVADKIRTNPALFVVARSTLSRWRLTVCNSSQPYLIQWEAIMDLGLEHCLSVVTEDSDTATALRQSSPFTSVLTNGERFAFFKQWNLDHETPRT